MRYTFSRRRHMVTRAGVTALIHNLICQPREGAAGLFHSARKTSQAQQQHVPVSCSCMAPLTGCAQSVDIRSTFFSRLAAASVPSMSSLTPRRAAAAFADCSICCT